MTDQLEGQMRLFDLDGSFGKTFQEPCHLEPPKEQTSKQCSRKSSKSSAKKPPLFLSLKTDGQKPDVSAEWVTAESPFPSVGEFTMRSFGEQPSTLMTEYGFREHHNGVSESRLSQILQDFVHQRYFLSGKACTGILRRAEKRCKELPEILKKALTAQAERMNGKDDD